MTDATYATLRAAYDRGEFNRNPEIHDVWACGFEWDPECDGPALLYEGADMAALWTKREGVVTVLMNDGESRVYVALTGERVV